MSEEKRFDLTPISVRLAALWVAAGALFKLIAGSPADLPAVLHDLPIEVSLFFKIAIGIELAIVCTALLRPTWGWLALVALFAVFDVVLAIVMASGAESCGCFGSSVTIAPWVMMAIDTLLLLGILASRPWKSETKAVGPAGLTLALAAVALIIPFPYIGEQALQSSEDGAVTEVEDLRWLEIDVESWTDQLIYDSEFAKIFPTEVETLPTDGLYIFWRWDCDHCASHLQQLADGDDGMSPIVLIRLMQEHDNDENGAVTAMPVGGHVTELSLPAGTQYIIQTPAEFILEGGMIVSATEGVGVEEK
ncbi:MAG: hypothetical protein ACI8X5_000797 [Planctomycetota bacterium]|jgi:hypothetical protein